MTPCPDRAELERFLEEELGVDRQEAVSRHVGACPGCQAALEALTRPAAASRPAAPSPPASFLQRLKNHTLRGPAASWRGLPPHTTLSGGHAEAPLPYPAVPGYELLAELGRGGMGVVYKARQVALNRVVALKMLQPGRIDRPRERERFRQEAEAVAQLRHPHIVHIYDIGEVEGRPYIALEYIEGGCLSHRLRGEPQPVMAAARLVEALARAVQFAHEQGVIHRDLKPGNVLLQRGESRKGGEDDGPEEASAVLPDGMVPRIADFGLAKRIDEPSTGTHTGEIVGTPSYMAPEQATAGRAVGPSADVYALGAILYELVTGRPPFKGATAVDTVVQLLHEEPVRPTSLRPDAPRDLETICLKCLEKEPRRRYASARALADDLARFRRGKPIAARAVGPVERAAKWARRHPLPSGLLAGLVLVALLGFAGVTWQWRKTTVARDTLLEEKAQTELQREQAEAARAEAARQRRQARTALYYSRIAQSQLSWRVNDIEGARQALEACHPGASVEDRRGWEWYYLKGLHEADLLTLTHQRPGAGGAVAYAPRGGAIASVLTGSPGREGDPGELRVWSAATGELLFRQALATGLQRLAFSPDGSRLALAGARGAALILDAADGRTRLRASPHGDTVSCVAYSPDGGQVATGSWDRTLKVWSATTGQVHQVLRGHADRVQDLAFHPSGEKLASGSWDGSIRLWDVKTGRCLRAIAAHPSAVFSVAFSPDGGLLASAAQNGNVKVWDVGTGRIVQSLTGNAGAVLHVGFSPDGRYLAYGGGDATVRVWDVESAVERTLFRGHTAPVEGVDFSPDGQRLASCSPKDGTVLVWDLTRHPELSVFAHADADLEALAFHTDGRRALSVAASGRLQAWDRSTGVLLAEHRLPAATRLPQFGPLVSFSPRGDAVAAPSRDDGRVRVWDAETARERLALPSPTHPVIGTAFSPDGGLLATAHLVATAPRPTHEARVYDARTGRPLAAFTGPGRAFRMAFHPGGDWLAVGREGGVDLVHWRTGRAAAPLPAHRGDVHALAFSPDGGRLASAGTEDRAVHVHGLSVQSDPPRLAHEAGRDAPCPRLVFDLAFSPDGQRLAGITRDLVKVWHAGDGVEVLTLRGAPQRYWDAPFNPRVVFSPDGGQLAGSNWDESFSVWEADLAADARPADARRAKRREAADARAVYWHLQEAAQCLRHRNLAAARFHLQRLSGASLPAPLRALREELLGRLASTGDKVTR